MQGQPFKCKETFTFFFLGHDRCLRLFGVGHNFPRREVNLRDFGHSQFWSLTPRRTGELTLCTTLNKWKLEVKRTSHYYPVSALSCCCITSYLCANAMLISVCKWHFNGWQLPRISLVTLWKKKNQKLLSCNFSMHEVAISCISLTESWLWKKM